MEVNKTARNPVHARIKKSQHCWIHVGVCAPQKTRAHAGPPPKSAVRDDSSPQQMQAPYLDRAPRPTRSGVHVHLEGLKNAELQEGSAIVARWSAPWGEV